MKKTIITVLLCLACAASSFATTYTFGTSLTTTGNTTDTTCPASAFDLLEGWDSTNYAQGTNTPHIGIYYVTERADVHWLSSSFKLDTANTYRTVDGTYVNTLPATMVRLTEMSLITTMNAITVSEDSTLRMVISDSNGVIGYSEVVSYDDNARKANTLGVATFTFSSAITLDTSIGYKFEICNVTFDDNGTAAYDSTATMDLAQIRSNYSSNGDKYLIDGNSSSHHLVYSITAVSIPEPATATLSLLALAGLAARRRRK